MIAEPTVGQRVQDPDTGMVGTITRAWNMSKWEWWIEVRWDNSTMEAHEVEPIEL